MKKQKGHKSMALRIAQKHYPQVTKVVDAAAPISITVTNEDGKKSLTKNHNLCAMAVACKREQKADGAIISVRSAYVIKGDTAIRYRVPSSVSREVVSFDRSGGFNPGSYELTAYGPRDRIGNFRPSGAHKPDRTPEKPKIRHTTTNIRTSLLRK